MVNFTMQDLIGSLLAFLLFVLVFVFPGYVLGWGLNLFDFRNRLPTVRYLLSIVLSNVLSPILLFLAYFFLGKTMAFWLVFGVAIAWGIIEFLSHWRGKSAIFPSPEAKQYQKIVVAIAGAWVVFSIFLLLDIQFGQRLYFSIVAYDYSTRVAVIDAITRTGVPPINPGYFPGHPVLLTQLYYFWYILGSLVDQLGGSWVSPHQAMIASVSWIGLVLMATLALYLRFRNNNRKIGVWRAALLTPQLLLVSGLDAIPVIVISVTGRIALGFNPLDGHIEGWNMPVMSWLNALAWVPHHIAGMLACITALMIFLYAMNKNKKQLPNAMLISGIAFASAVGLSFWAMFMFAFFWVLWIVVLFLKKEDRKVLLMMILAATLGLVLVSPFLIGILHSETSNSSGGSLPIQIYVRPFIISKFFAFLPQWTLNILNLLFLPLNYLFELGFYLAIAVLWFQMRKTEWKQNPYFLAETLLIITVIVLLSFVRSTIIVINDLGIRGWLFGQFMLIIWAVDVLEKKLGNKTLLLPSIFKRFVDLPKLGTALSLMFVIGVLTTSLEVVSIRLWPMFIDVGVAGFPTGLSTDTQLGQRTYNARLAYDFISEHVPGNTIIQYNPMTFLDRPSGLYGNHQMAISDRTAYGISTEEFQSRAKEIGAIFQGDTNSDWTEIDKLCKQYYIDVLVIKDTDPVWRALDHLMLQRSALYKNQFYAVFSCGSFSQTR